MTDTLKPKVVIAYIPVLANNYRQFLMKHLDAGELLIFGDEVIGLFDHLRKDIRRLSPIDMRIALESLQLIKPVRLLDLYTLNLLNQEHLQVVMPDEDISHELATGYLPRASVKFDDSIRLRWNKNNILGNQAVKPDRFIVPDEFSREVMAHAYRLADQSDDWWRQVGGVIARNGEILLDTFNRHLPANAPLFNGDPRSNFKKGLHYELSTAAHVEAQLIALAARKGIPLEGTSLYVTTYPCPPCAKIIAFSGIKKLYFVEGYAVLDGESNLKEAEVEIIQVKIQN